MLIEKYASSTRNGHQHHPHQHHHYNGYLPSPSSPCPYDDLDDDDDHDLDILKENFCSGGGDEPSIIEYGPGIVRKLRSKYQSLALRQYSSSGSGGSRGRTSLRRAASLENGLENDEGKLILLPVPTPKTTTAAAGAAAKNNFLSSSRTSKIEQVTSAGDSRMTGTGPLSRLRRARSVDILHQQNHQDDENQEEVVLPPPVPARLHATTEEQKILLEKFRSVVSPKEEVIIIEMTKSTHIPYQFDSNVPVPPVALSEKELPPHDIVRDTARLFESNSRTNWRKIGNSVIQQQSTNNQNQSRLNNSNNKMDTKKQKAIVLPVVKSERERSKSPTPTPVPPVEPTSPVPPSPSPQLQLQPPPIPARQAQSTSPTRQIGIIRPTFNRSPHQGPDNFTRKPPGKPPLSPKPITFVQKSRHSPSPSPSPSPAPAPVPAQAPESSNIPAIPGVVLKKTDFVISKEPAKSTSTLPFPINLKPTKVTESTQKNSISSSIAEKSEKSTEKSMPKKSIVSSKSNEKEAEGWALKHGTKNNANATITTTAKSQISIEPIVPETEELSDLRTYQKKKSLEKSKGSGGGSGPGAPAPMVFNFTKTRSKVPDYIEDDGLYSSSTDAPDGSGSTESQSQTKLLQFIGANIIINGRSSLQKKPKSQKMKIKFNESGTTTFEYPSESSLVVSDEEEVEEKLGQESTGGTGTSGSGLLSHVVNNNNGGGLGSYTPSKSAMHLHTHSYQLGSYRGSPEKSTTALSNRDSENNETETEEQSYLKPDSGSTTWSSEIGAADILF